MAEETEHSEVEANWKDIVGGITGKTRSSSAKRNKRAKKNAEEESGEGEEETGDLQEKINATFSPTNLRELVSMPANIMLSTTGHQHWLLSSEEKDVMAEGASSVAKTFIRTDPKWATLCIALLNIGMVYGYRIKKEYDLRREEVSEEVKS